MAVVGAFLIGLGTAMSGGILTGFAAGVLGAIGVASTLWSIASSFFGASAAKNGISGDISVADTLASPSYSFGKLITQTNSSLTIPVIYGNFKAAGNVVYQTGSTVLDRLTSFCFGEISGFSDIRLNDNPIESVTGATYTAYTGNGIQTIDSRVPGATNAERAALVGGLKHEAYLATTVTANEQINSDFNITALVAGKLVNVYDQRLIDESGDLILFEDGDTIRMEQGTYIKEWSNNPVYCLLDILTSYEGLGMSTSALDMESFIETARYCDEIISGTQKRFTLNITLDQKKSALGWIAEVCKASQSIFGKRGDKWFLIADKAEDTTSVPVFTKDNINELACWFLEMDNTYDIINANYKDADYEWTFVQARAEADVYLRDDYPLVNTFDVLGVTNFNQASRLAWFYLNQAILTPMFISFKTSKKGLNLTVGDIFAVDDYLLGFSGKFYRVLALSESQNNQIEVTAREYNATLYSDTAGSADPTINFLQNEYSHIFLQDYSGWILQEGSSEDYIIL
jgi:hypothetical protein